MGGSEFLVTPPRPLASGAVLAARTIAAGRISAFGQTSTVDNDRDSATLSFVGTEWVAQITGDAALNGKPTQSHTSDVDVIGTDLGVSVEHVFAGEARTYFFFGDTAANNQGPDGDSIAWTADRAPTVRGFRLNFVVDGAEYRRLTIPGVSLGGFEVPSGAFSHAGKLYVFATTKHFKEPNPGHPDWDVMGASVLATAADPHGDFTKLYQISSRADRATGGFKFINISPEVVANDDVQGLPAVAVAGGSGLLMVGSGVYRRSSPYLGYAPLPDGADPARADWRFLSGFDLGIAGYGPLGRPKWSGAEADAVPIFVDDQVGELSFSWHPDLRRWLLLYGGTILRSARWPWGPWTAPVVTFDYTRDNGATFIGPGGGTYGPYIIRRFSTWDGLRREATLHNLMSTWVPYDASLVRTVLRLDCA
jgi:hypothetical protein